MLQGASIEQHQVVRKLSRYYLIRANLQSSSEDSEFVGLSTVGAVFSCRRIWGIDEVYPFLGGDMKGILTGRWVSAAGTLAFTPDCAG
jgi:hypothetical protein